MSKFKKDDVIWQGWGWHTERVTAVGEKHYLIMEGEVEESSKEIQLIDSRYKIYTPPRKMIKMSQAVLGFKLNIVLSDQLFKSIEDVKAALPTFKLIQFPLLDADSNEIWYSVPEVE